MLKNKNNSITGQSKPMVQCLFLLGVGAFSAAHATDYVYSGSGSNYNLNSGDTLTIESGTFSQNISLPSGATITVEEGANFSPSSLNNGSGSLIVNAGATASLPGVAFNNGLVIDNSGNFTFASNINMNGSVTIINRSKVDGFDEPVMNFVSSFQLSNGSKIDNQGIMSTSQDFNTQNGTELVNSGTIKTANFNPNGEFTNNGFIRATGFININSNSTVVNNCSYIAESGFNNNSDLVNNGIVLVLASNAKIQLNDPLYQTSLGYMQGVEFTNNNEVTGLGNYYFTGSTINQGTFGWDDDLGGDINFYDASLSDSAKFFDSQNSTPLNTTKNSIEPITETQAITHCTYASIVTEASLDFGDAPTSYGDASHIITGNIYIGSNPPDAETSGQSDAAAYGDDSNGSTPDDEEGVVFPEVEQGGQIELNIPVNGQGGYLQAWIDWNGDGDFNDTDEQVATNLQDNGILSDSVTGDGTIDVLITAPDDATTETTYARFRWSTDVDLGSQGQATDGEVEDYALTIDVAEVNASCTINDIASNGYSSASPSASSRFLSNKTYVYTATFDSSDWSSEVLAYDLNTESNEGGTKSVVWNSSSTISSIGRSLFTYNPDAETASGRVLSWDNLSAAQQSTLAGADGEAAGEARVDWLFGQTSNLRQRSHLLGDIINSSLTIKAPLTNYGYQALSGTEGTSYASFLQSKVSSTTSLFVGSNNGMFHALNAENGEELFAYVPNEVLSKVPTISDVKYGCSEDDCLSHEYLVDGQSTLGDAYLSNSWSSVVVGTLGLGGRGLFALDVTDPDNFSSSDVLWEISATQAPDNESTFANHLGYTLPSASIVRAPNGQWLAITGNGYDSESKQAVLFIIDLETGELVKAINTLSGSSDKPNGLSTPTVVDSDGDAIADRIYAGDLLGNVWAFDISSNNSNDWSVVYGSDTAPESLFRACSDDTCSNYQPITAPPQVSKNKVAGLMVYVGTGKYTDIADGLTANTQAEFDTFYGIQDNGVVVERTDLIEQEILAEVAVSDDLNSRITSDNTVDYTTKRGWFLDLQTPPNGTNEGERVVSQAILSGGRIIFTTLTPSAASCSFSGESWIMELNAQDGSRLSVITFDLNDDLFFTSEDNSTYNGSTTIVSGVQQPSLGIVRSTPVIVANTTSAEGKYVTGSEGGIGMFRESASDFRGRMSWRNISN